MANIFPREANRVFPQIVIGVSLVGAIVVGALWYYFTPKYVRVGYMPVQPVAFNHELHVTQLGLDCRYCHQNVERSANSTIPSTQTCMACHQNVKTDSPKLAALRESWQTGLPVRWVRVHKAPDFVYFNHSAHVNRGVSCAHCHGAVNHMPVLYHDQPQSMSWCLECHRDPAAKIRPPDKVFDLDWRAPTPEAQRELGAKLVKEWGVNPPVTCAGCHR
ncbi:MAG: cytochrome C [Verrucomicrobiae bacterium]|nr:cytochrome C [Verrucomicrobiae bacterium]